MISHNIEHNPIKLFIETYNPPLGIIRMLDNITPETFDECVDIIHYTIFKKSGKVIRDIDRQILELLNDDKSYDLDKMICAFHRMTHIVPKIDNVDDMYILFAYLRESGFRNIIIEKIFIDNYLPYVLLATPYNRDENLKARYTSSIKGDVIQINIPSKTGGIIEKLNQTHIDLGKQQIHKK